jgi:hypothetical protein
MFDEHYIADLNRSVGDIEPAAEAAGWRTVLGGVLIAVALMAPSLIDKFLS